MGFRTSWIAHRGTSSQELLTRLNLVATGERFDLTDLGFYLLELPDAEKGPWTTIIADGSEYYQELNASIAREFSADGEALYFWCSDTVMCTELLRFEGGRLVWAIRHDCEADPPSQLEGPVPAEYRTMLEDLKATQRSADAEGDDVDHLYDLTAMVGQDLTGYKHDLGAECEDPEPFQVLRRRS